MSVKSCRICHQEVPPKNRKNVFNPKLDYIIPIIGQIERSCDEFRISSASGQDIPVRSRSSCGGRAAHRKGPCVGDGKSDIICYSCFSSINKLHKLDFELSTRYAKDKANRDSAFEKLKNLHCKQWISGPTWPRPGSSSSSAGRLPVPPTTAVAAEGSSTSYSRHVVALQPSRSSPAPAGPSSLRNVPGYITGPGERLLPILSWRPAEDHPRGLCPVQDVHGHAQPVVQGPVHHVGIHQTPSKIPQPIFKTPKGTKRPRDETPCQLEGGRKRLDFKDTPEKKDGQPGSKSKKQDKTVKVMIIDGDGFIEKSRVIKPESGLQKLCLAISRYRPDKCIANAAYRTLLLQPELHRLALEELARQCKGLCSLKEPSVLRSTSPEALKSFSTTDVATEWEKRAPLLKETLCSISGKPLMPHSIYAGASLLKCRNRELSRSTYAVGLALNHGGATDKTISIMHRVGVSMTPSSLRNKIKEIGKLRIQTIQDNIIGERKKVEEYWTSISVSDSAAHSPTIGNQRKPSCNFDIVSDNCDITVRPTYMTSEKQNKSLHWFLNLAVEKRISDPRLPNEKSKDDIRTIDSVEFLPNAEDCASLDDNLCYHISKILKDNLDFLKEFYIPSHIRHPFIKETSKKSNYVILDLLDKNENKSDDMIDILSWIHEEFVPHSQAEIPETFERIVFAGDVLTNERAYSGQMAMLNGETCHERLGGIIHRPEGFHRLMNLTLLIFQKFYSQQSSGERGTLCQLRNLINRRDVKGADSVVSDFRSHFTFLEDVLHALITTCALDHFGMETSEMTPALNKPPPITLLNDEAQYKWINTQAKIILQRYVKLEVQLERLQEDVRKQQDSDRHLDAARQDDGTFHCHCGATYRQKSRYIMHARKVHDQELQPQPSTAQSSTDDSLANYVSSLIKCLLLLHDTSDAYQFGDGDRIFRNAKFEILLYDVGGHTKYRMWMFRTLAYDKAILTEKEAFEYRWNCCFNSAGGMGRNIPNDNLVEINVKKLKDSLKAQGANVNFENAQLAARTLQDLDAIVDVLMEDQGLRQKSGKKTSVSKKADCDKMIKQLKGAEITTFSNGRELGIYTGFQDLFKRINVFKVSKWINEQKKAFVIP